MENQISSVSAGLRRYFQARPTAPDLRVGRRMRSGGALLAGLGSVFLVAASTACGRLALGFVFLVGGIVLALRGHLEILRLQAAYRKALAQVYPQPTDREVDLLFSAGLQKLLGHSLQRLGLTAEECQEIDLPPVCGPVLWNKPGLEGQDLVWRVGSDGVARFGVYNITFLWMAKRHVGVFQCDYSFVRDAILNAETHEYFYRDIVSVTTRERASALTLPRGEAVTTEQEFCISVSGDRFFKMTVGSSELKKLTGAETIPESGADRAVQALRSQLRNLKESPAPLE